MINYETKDGKVITLRLPNESDAKEIINFYKQVAKETTYLSFGEGEYQVTEEQQISSINSANQSDNNTMVLATIDSKLIGIGTISSNQKKKGKHVGILGIVISEDYCNIGLGKIMMDYLIDWCKSNNITTKISLSVRKDNPRAIHLYEKCGFVTEGILVNETLIDGEYFDIVTMGLVL